MKRREFLRAGSAGLLGTALGAGGLFTWVPRANASLVTKTYYITDGYITQPDGVDVYFRGFSNASGSLRVPGESLVVQEGDTVRVTIHNTLNSTHTFVIDGLVDSGAIGGGQSKTIEFTAGSPGTHLFYDNLNAPYNRVTGLHGGLAVMPAGSGDQLYPGSPTFVQQYFWVFNDCDPAWNKAVRDGYQPSSAFKPRYFTINGLSGRPAGAPDYYDPDVNAMHNPDTALHGHVGDRTLVRVLNAGMCTHAIHTHGNHMEWLTENGAVRPQIWLKDVVYLRNNMGKCDVIYPFEPPPDAYPPVNTGAFPMHLHDEMTQTAGGGLYMFGALTDIFFE